VIVCGVDIKASEARLALVTSTADESIHIACDTKKLLLINDQDVKSLISMKTAIEAFAQQNKVESFVIKSRQSKGQLAASGVTFKIEALFQLSLTPVIFVSPPTIAKFSKSNEGGVPSSVLIYQTDAYRAGAYHLAQI
jgi:hypothetical protein